MALGSLLEATTVALLAAALALFLAHSSLAVWARRGPALDFGAGFSLFLAGWIGAELVAIFAPPAWTEGDEILHFGVLAAFAVWMNLRWRWALRRAQEVP